MRKPLQLGLGAAALAALVGGGAFYLGTHQAPAAAPFQAAQPSGKPGAAADPYLAGPVKNTLRKETGAMQKLWLAYLQKANAKEEGVVELDWRITPDGNVSHAGVVSSDLADKELEEGLVRLIAQLNFPPPGAAQKYVTHKFNFKKEPVAQ